MFTAADLIQVLQRRWVLVSPHRRRAPGEFPPGWRDWFASMEAKLGAVKGAPAAALVDVLLERPLTPSPRRSGELTRWQAFNTLWRQEWQAPGPEDRKVRWFAGVFTVAWHLFFGGLLLWLMYARFAELEEAAAARRRGEEEVVQVEFIGRGTPREVGGGPAPAPEAEAPEDVSEARVPAPAAQEIPSATPPEATPRETAAIPAPEVPPIDAPALDAPPVDAPALDAPVPDVPQREVPEPQLPPVPTVTQDVAVSAPVPDTSEFVLPPVTPRVAVPQVAPQDITAPAPSLQAVEVPEPVQPIRSARPPVRVVTPTLESPLPEVVEREVAAPVRRPDVRKIEQTAPQPTVVAPDVRVPVRDIPTPAVPTPATPGPSAPASTTTRSATPSATSAAPASAAAASSGTSPTPSPAAQVPGRAAASATAPAGGQGPRPDAAPGGFPTPAADDDWGASMRNVPGGQRGEPSGLYDALGGPRAGEPPVNPGQPPGTLDDRIVDLDRSGTWLKRKPTDYEPTTFDRYWRPHENLLEEWVRKGIKKMAIPIPGTNKKIECVVSILQFGGGCGISDPNLNDQPAGARPPPDVPFKPHLQESNGSAPPGG